MTKIDFSHLSVVEFHFNQEIFSIPSSQICNKTTREILDLVKQRNKLPADLNLQLSIISLENNVDIVLPYTVNPFDLCSSLFHLISETFSQKAEYFLSVQKVITEVLFPTFSCEIQVIYTNNDKTDYYNLQVSLPYDSVNPKSIKKLTLEAHGDDENINLVHMYTMSGAEIASDEPNDFFNSTVIKESSNQTAASNKNAQNPSALKSSPSSPAFKLGNNSSNPKAMDLEFKRNLIEKKYYIGILLDISHIKTMEQRFHASKELLQKELDYFEVISNFKANTYKVFDYLIHKNCITADQHSFFFQYFDIIVEFHRNIHHDLTKQKYTYSMLIGKIMKKYSNQYAVIYQKFLELFQQIQPKLIEAENSSNQRLKKIFLDFEKSPYSKGISFMSVLHNVPQRCPRIWLHLKEILKGTPKGHPDYKYLVQAKKEVRANNHKMDEYIDTLSRLSFINELKNTVVISKLTNEYMFNGKFLVPNKFKKVFILYKDDLKYELVFFVGEIWLLYVVRENKRVIRGRYLYPSLSLEVLPFDRILLRSRYENFILKSEAIEACKNIMNTYKAQSEAASPFVFNWQIADQSRSISYLNSSIVFLNNCVYIFGGIKSSSQISQEFVCYVPQTHKVVTLKIAPTLQRHSSAYTVFSNKIYIFGGVDVNYKPLNDLWVYDRQKWTQIVPANKFNPPASNKYALTTFQNKLFLIGGENNKLCMYSYQTFKKIWNQIEYDAITPICNFDDQLEICKLSDNTAILLMNSSLYYFSINNGRGKIYRPILTGFVPSNFNKAKMVNVNKNIVFLTPDAQKFIFIMSSDFCFSFPKLTDELGKVKLENESLCSDDKGFWIIGGRDLHKNEDNDTLYRVNVTLENINMNNSTNSSVENLIQNNDTQNANANTANQQNSQWEPLVDTLVDILKNNPNATETEIDEWA
ncbi:hypothetical protein TRFO_08577 [Tritrichomonas foetus]|uniref:DH domain-containing protein n=1 Tax=Tritrichomonas foetus TaxID=1144522 RepID=A0A1J4JK89_9EUKA|nr:hypothetical protein TRFO_08577 [Tritrichomonas foetus]|eukprot:OHS99025.1 hypothetical protein TRFO_08577 [Tritrichomonas foetus]